MHRIDSATADADANGTGKAGFTEGDPSTATPPTGLTAAFFNSVQEEIATVVEGAGLTLDKEDNGQLFAALRRVIVQDLAVANWDARANDGGVAVNFDSVASDGAGTIVLVGSSGAIQSSVDNGKTWTARTAGGSPTSFGGVAWGGGTWVAVSNGTTKVNTSSDGATWTEPAGASADIGASAPFGIAYGAGRFVSVWGSGAIYTSDDDGETWSSRTGVSSTTACVGFGDDLFVTGGSSGQIQTSPDGVTWTARTQDASYAGTFRGHAHGDGLHVIVGDSGEIQTSPDGIAWTHRTSGVAFALRSVAYGAGAFVAVGDSPTQALVSRDGVTWSRVTIPDGGALDLLELCFDGGGFVAVGEDGRILTSLRAVDV